MGPFDSAWLASTVILTVPLLLAGVGELFSERAGILNIGLEGMMLMGAFWAFWGEWYYGNIWVGMLIGIIAGMVLAAVMAVFSIQARADQVVIGVGLNILALGITGYMFREIFGDRGSVELPRLGKVAIPGLSSIPGVGQPLFNQSVIVYLAFALIPISWFILYRTTWGLNLRAVGSVPAAADTGGVRVNAVRWQALLVTGALAGLGGATLSVVDLGLFQQDLSAGRGFIALAAVIFGRWRPLGLLLACIVFGATDALQLRLQASGDIPRQVWVAILLVGVIWVVYTAWRWQQRRHLSIPNAVAATVFVAIGAILVVTNPQVSLPSQLWLSVPYVLTIIALATFSGGDLEPAALARPYNRALEA